MPRPDMSPDRRKSTVEEIRTRFDNNVERFSNLATGQANTIDGALAMDLLAQSAAATTPHARDVLDVGCGAGNYTLKLLEKLPGLNSTLVDLSQPMLDRASERVAAATSGTVRAIQGDIREIPIDDGSFDVILAAAVLHHLRSDDEWRQAFAKFHRILRPGGSIWIFDLVEGEIPAVGELMWERYGQFLTLLRDEIYRQQVFDYIAEEDSPRPLLFQVDRLREAGFGPIEIVHKTACFAAFGAVKAK